MTFFRSLVFSTLLLAGMLAWPLSAQPSSGGPLIPARTFRVICGGNWQAPSIKYDLNSRPVTLEVERALSQPYVCPSGNLVLYNEIPPPPDATPGTPPRKQVLATLPMASEQTRFLVVLTPDQTGKISFKIVSDDVEKHPAGTLRILNFSDFAAAVALNSDQYTVPQDSSNVVMPFASGGTLIQSAIQKDGKWIPTYRRERIARPRLHSYGFVFNFISEIGAQDVGPPPTAFMLIGELPAAQPAQEPLAQASRR